MWSEGRGVRGEKLRGVTVGGTLTTKVIFSACLPIVSFSPGTHSTRWEGGKMMRGWGVAGGEEKSQGGESLK